MDTCWNCKSDIKDTALCDYCETIQPDGPDNYFQFLDVKKTLTQDNSELKRKYYQLSRKFHPDFHQNHTDEERRYALHHSATLNRAYDTLKDPIARVRYMMSIYEIGFEAHDKNVPPALAERAFDVQDLIAECRFAKSAGEEFDANALQIMDDEFLGDLKKLDGEFQEKFAKFDKANSREERVTILQDINRKLPERNYLEKLEQEISGVL